MSTNDMTPKGWTRALWPGEEERLVRHLLRLSPEDLHSRFMGSANEATIRAHIARAKAGDWQVIGWFDRGTLSAAVEIVTVGPVAEVAFTTEPGYRRHGIAHRLLDLAIRRAARAGAERLILFTAQSNAPMIALARTSGATLQQEGGEITAELSLVPPDALSVYRDLLEERRGQLASAAAQLFPVSTQVWSAVLDPPPPAQHTH